jgi:hypothetical protein
MGKGLKEEGLKERGPRENHQATHSPKAPKAPTYLLWIPRASRLITLPVRMGPSQTAQALRSGLMIRPRRRARKVRKF